MRLFSKIKSIKNIILMYFLLLFCIISANSVYARAESSGLTESACLTEGADDANFSNVVVFVYFDDADADYLDKTYWNTQTYADKFRSLLSGSSLYSLSSYLQAISYSQLRVQNIFPQYDGTKIVPYKITSVSKADAESGYYKDTVVKEVMTHLDAISGTNLDLYKNDGCIDNLQIIYIQNDDLEFTSVHKSYDGSLSWSGKTVAHFNVIGTNCMVDSYAGREAGILSHEFLHTIGFPDLYNNNNDNPVMTWDQMGSASPKQSYPLAYLRSKLGGWFDLDTISESKTGLKLDNQENENGTHAYILESSKNKNEVFVVEMRKRNRTAGEEHLDYYAAVSDPNMNNNGGLIVYRVKKNVEGLSNYGGDTAVYVFRPASVTVNGVDNTDSMTCVQYAALNKESGRTSIGSSDTDATLSDGALTFSDGTNSGIVISNVSTGQGDSMTFDVSFPEVDAKDVWNNTTISSADFYSTSSVAELNDVAYMATYYNDIITLYSEKDGGWTKQGVSLTGISDLNAMKLVTNSGSLYLLYNCYDSGLSIRKWSGSVWTTVASDTAITSYFDAASINGSLYVSYIDGDYPKYNAKLLQLSGSSLNNKGTYQTGFLGQPQLCAFGSNLAVGVRDASSNLYIYQFANGKFTKIDNQISNNYFDMESIGSKLYVIAGASDSAAKLYTYNQGWSAVSLNDIFTNAFLHVRNGKLYIAGAYDADAVTHTHIFDLNADNSITRIGENISAVANCFASAGSNLYVGAITKSGSSQSLTMHILSVKDSTAGSDSKDDTDTGDNDKDESGASDTDKDDDHIHSYVSKITKATLSSDGKIIYCCSQCNQRGKADKLIARPTTFTLSASSYAYNGKVHTPSLTVYDSAGKQISASNYSITYPSGRKNVGTYKYKITFKGSYYSGVKYISYNIVPGNATIKSLVSGSKYIIEKAYSKPTALAGSGYQIAYRIAGTSKWTYMTTVYQNKKISALKKGKKYQLRIRAYKKLGSTVLYGAWSKVKTSPTVK